MKNQPYRKTGIRIASVQYSPIFDPEDLSIEVDDVLIALLVSDRIDKKEAISLSHVLLSHGTELLLPCRV